MLFLGTHTVQQLIDAARAREPFLILADPDMAREFAKHLPDATIFNPLHHSFEIKRDADASRDFGDILFPEKDLMTYLHGKQELAKLVCDNTTPLDKLDGDRKDPAVAEALRMRDALLFSPVLKRVLTRKPNFSFEGSVIAKIDRTKLLSSPLGLYL